MLVYITLGGLTSAIYNEVLQFFVIVRQPAAADARGAALGGWLGRAQGSGQGDFKPLGEPGLHAWKGLGDPSRDQPARLRLGRRWCSASGFVLSFGYWTTNFAEVQRALSAKNMSASRRTPLIGAYPKIFLPRDHHPARG